MKVVCEFGLGYKWNMNEVNKLNSVGFHLISSTMKCEEEGGLV